MKKSLYGCLLLVVSLALSTGCNKKSDSNAAYKPESVIIVAPSGPGGGADKTARSLSKMLFDTKIVDAPITVENVPGASGAKFLAAYVSKDVGNNDKLFISSPAILINNLRKEGNSPVGYKDVTPLAGLTQDFGAIVVKADSPLKSIQDLINAVKADPSKVSIGGGSSPGGIDYVLAMLPLYKSGVDVRSVKYIPHDGGGIAMTALLGGNLEAIATDASGVSEYVKSGKVRVLAVSAPTRINGIDAPTYKEAGIDAEFVIWRGVFGPKDMSPSAKAYWSDALLALSNKPEWANELKTQGWEASFKDSAAFTTYLEQQSVEIKELFNALQMAK